jgi:hypothetical protein
MGWVIIRKITTISEIALLVKGEITPTIRKSRFGYVTNSSAFCYYTTLPSALMRMVAAKLLLTAPT